MRERAPEELPALLARPEARVWVDLSAPVGDAEIAILRDVFKFHPLAIEDCLGSRAQPKVDEYDGYLYLITHGLSAGATRRHRGARGARRVPGPQLPGHPPRRRLAQRRGGAWSR